MPNVEIGSRRVADGERVFVIPEIGINHNGDIEIAKKLIDVAAAAGCDAVKFQKRTPEVVQPPDQRDIIRETPLGTMTYLKYRERIELGKVQYDVIANHAEQAGVLWFASCWDEDSVDFMEAYDPPAYKIASACFTDDNLLRHHRLTGRPIIMSTGISSMEQIDHLVELLG
jgi:N-acetylneuraminate synthase